VAPSTPFSGVRISWLTADRNADFARVPASARTSASRSRASSSRRAVMSSFTATNQAGRPSGPGTPAMDADSQ
jgi:hypothetical protein